MLKIFAHFLLLHQSHAFLASSNTVMILAPRKRPRKPPTFPIRSMTSNTRTSFEWSMLPEARYSPIKLLWIASGPKGSSVISSVNLSVL